MGDWRELRGQGCVWWWRRGQWWLGRAAPAAAEDAHATHRKARGDRAGRAAPERYQQDEPPRGEGGEVPRGVGRPHRPLAHGRGQSGSGAGAGRRAAAVHAAPTALEAAAAATTAVGGQRGRAGHDTCFGLSWSGVVDLSDDDDEPAQRRRLRSRSWEWRRRQLWQWRRRVRRRDESWGSAAGSTWPTVSGSDDVGSEQSRTTGCGATPGSAGGSRRSGRRVWGGGRQRAAPPAARSACQEWGRRA